MGKTTSYLIDDLDLIQWVNDQWSVFAAENDGMDVIAEVVIGKLLWDFIHDMTTVHLYRLMLQEVRLRGVAMSFDLRCDSPDRRRFMNMQVRGEDGMVRFDCKIVREEPRTPEPLLDRETDRSEVFISMCSWCTRIPVDSHWLNLEDAVRRLGLFKLVRLPMISHSICPDCYEKAMRSLKSGRPADG